MRPEISGRERREFTEPSTHCKLEIFMPEAHLRVLQKALQEADVGHIGKYDSCMPYSPVTGCQRPPEGSSPFIGKCGTISTEPESKTEVACRTGRSEETLATIKKVCPYEEPAISAIPLYMVGIDTVPWYWSYSGSPCCPIN